MSELIDRPLVPEAAAARPLPAEAEIDHPSHTDWWQASDDWLIEHHGELQADLRRRFQPTNQNFDTLWAAVEHGIARTNAYRVTHERLNSTLVSGYAEYQPDAPSPVLSAEAVPVLRGTDRYDYDALAGHDITLDRYVPWVGRAALAAFATQLAYCGKFNSVSLEIGGVGQAGNWDGTARLDGIMAALPERLRAAHTELQVAEFSHDAKRSYQFIPMREMVGHELDISDLSDEERKLYTTFKMIEWEYRDIPPEFAMIRRRRPLFDVYAPSGELVRVFKQSVGLLVLGQLPKAVRDAAWQAAQVYPDFDALSAEQQAQITQRQELASGLAAAMCGAVFERAIREREASTMVVPLSMQGIMKVKRPSPAAATT
jgi:hypothetical protein